MSIFLFNSTRFIFFMLSEITRNGVITAMAIEKILAARKKSAVSIQNPQRGEKKILVQLAIILPIIRV